MKKIYAGVFFVIAVACASASAQIFKLPTIGPKPSPTPRASPTNAPQPPINHGSNGSMGTAQTPQGSEKPLLLATTLDIRCDTEARYWKMPGESSYTSWIPMVKFRVVYTGAEKLRLMAEYSTPDGKPWFSETLKLNKADSVEKTMEMITDRVGPRFEGKSTIATGLFGVKIVDSKDGSVLFQGNSRSENLNTARTSRCSRTRMISSSIRTGTCLLAMFGSTGRTRTHRRRPSACG
ncbi:MAG: hypothetical protein IPG67_04095 [Acidobacteria bacterium]|nr:hypothetical protein [Acidobacteriota bacterium]